VQHDDPPFWASAITPDRFDPRVRLWTGLERCSCRACQLPRAGFQPALGRRRVAVLRGAAGRPVGRTSPRWGQHGSTSSATAGRTSRRVRHDSPARTSTSAATPMSTYGRNDTTCANGVTPVDAEEIRQRQQPIPRRIQPPPGRRASDGAAPGQTATAQPKCRTRYQAANSRRECCARSLWFRKGKITMVGACAPSPTWRC
jgi:hypothetical protein